ncbi:MAG: hypothetical protein KC933_20810 [Myxococcales bacterium]|nr:hypothetical protein [Myxococcales bacterium]MCB9649445.1 hypothetical protein [Deltaproteobacteria bacterium]
MTDLGAEPVPTTRFTPFLHELVRVDSTTSAEIHIEAVLWPGFKLGPLLISRAGCVISAPLASLRPDVASTSTLYWAYARNNRPAEDLWPYDWTLVESDVP